MFGYNDYGYGYGYDPLRTAGSAGVLLFVAFVAAIVMTVIVYRKYARIPGQQLVKLGDKSTWTPFLRFDTLLIERILKVLYIFNLVFIPLSCLAVALSAFTAGFGAGLAALVGMAVTCVIGEVITRLVFEGIMLQVIVARNTSDIRRALGVGDPMDADGISSPAPRPQEYAAAQAIPTCPTCGAPIKPGSAFCGSCGTRLQ